MKFRAHKTVSMKQNLRGNFGIFFNLISICSCSKGTNKIHTYFFALVQYWARLYLFSFYFDLQTLKSAFINTQ